MRGPFYTIGHSTRTIDEFVKLLREPGVTFVVDVRTVPRSRANPQYNGDGLPGSLASFEIGYEHIAALGGLRGRQRDIPAGINAFWRNDSFHNYADYAMGVAFREGFEHLVEVGHTRCCAIMCAEAVWWRCHRRIITDYLIASGEKVYHILAPGRVEEAYLTDAARREASGVLTYPVVNGEVGSLDGTAR